MPHQWVWADDRVVSMDFETSGLQPEFALQSWRILSGEAWATSMVWVWPQDGRVMNGGGLVRDRLHARGMINEFITHVLHYDIRVCGWNLAFDIGVLIAYGAPIEKLRRVKWLDGYLLWRHLDVEPEYDDKGPRRSYSLKTYVRQRWPLQAGYEADVNFHDDSLEARVKLHRYNIQDCVFTLMGCKTLWNALTPAQQRAASIEADCLVHVAEANVRGMLVDTILAQDVVIKQSTIAAERLASLAPFGVTEKIVRSPKQLATLFFDTWGLPVQKNTATGNRSTDKEVMHELAFIDPRVKEVKEYREALNNVTKFAMNPIAAARYNGDGRARPQAIVFGTYTGRMTYASKQTKKNPEEAEVADASD
jgi:DNA polymerase I-like protein with 3'-5' exonuclease and polymerase domains